MDSLPLSIYLDRFFSEHSKDHGGWLVRAQELNLKKLHLRMLGVRHQEAQVCNLAFRCFLSHGATAAMPCVRRLDIFQTKHFQDRRAKFEQEQVSDKSVFSWDQFCTGDLDLAICCRDWLQTGKLHDGLQPRRLTWALQGRNEHNPAAQKHAFGNLFGKELSMNFISYSMTLWVPSLTWNTNTETRKLQAAREDKSRVDWRLWLKLLCIPDGIRSSVHDLSGFPMISSGRLNTMSPADARRTWNVITRVSGCE